MRQQFDRQFVQRLRREVGDQALDILWFPREKHQAQAVSENGAHIGWRPNGARGCWVVVKQGLLPSISHSHGSTVITHKAVTFKVFKLNGKYGNPMLPGHWTIRALCASDTVRRGAMVRLRELNQWQRDALERRYVQADLKAAEDLAASGLRSVLDKVRQEVGLGSHDREEHLAAWKKAEQDAERAEARREALVRAESLL